MHKLSGKWEGSSECHVANAGDWLVVGALAMESHISNEQVPMMNCSGDDARRFNNRLASSFEKDLAITNLHF
jgi:hypothetical protein